MKQAGEDGRLGDVTYQAIYDVQLYYESKYGMGQLTRVCDDSGSFMDGTGNYYPIDERTYVYIMEELAGKP